MSDPDRLGPRLDSVTYDGKVTGIDHLTGFEYPVNQLVLVATDTGDFSIDKARYVSRFCYKYGVGKLKKPPTLVTESSLEVIEKAIEQNVKVEIREHNE